MLRKIKITNSGIGSLISKHVMILYRHSGICVSNPLDGLFELKSDMSNLTIQRMVMPMDLLHLKNSRQLWVTDD